MPIVCVNRPNRTKKRTWGPPGLTRIVAHVCDSHGPEATEAAFKEGFCGETQCEKIVNEVLSAIAGAGVAWAVLGALQNLLEIRWLAFLLRKTAIGRVMSVLLAQLSRNIPSFASKQAEIEWLQTALKTWIRTDGKIWIERPPF